MTGPQRVRASLRAQQPALDARLADALAGGADAGRLRAAVAEAVEVAEGLDPAPTQVDAVVAALVDQACTAARTGPGSPAARVLHDLAPALGPWLLADPAGCLAGTTTAARAVARGGPDALAAWTARLVRAAGQVDDAAHVRALGVVTAWRSGVVRVREAALAAADDLPATALAAALELPGGARAAVAANAADPWEWPGRGPEAGQLRVVARAGGFTGFGGPWPVPPVVLAGAAGGSAGVSGGGDGLRWHVRAGAVSSVLVWDCFGSAVLPRPPGPDDGPAAPPDLLDRRGRLHLAGLQAAAPWDDVLTGAAVVGRTAVLSRAGSHLVDLLRAGAA